MIKVAINGFGRIGSLAFRAAIMSDDVEVVAISAPNHPASHVAYCVKYDTVHGRFPGVVTADDEASTITVNGKTVKVLSDKKYRDAALLPWGELGVEYVLECTGAYLTKEKAQAHVDAGAQVVVMSGPASDDTPCSFAASTSTSTLLTCSSFPTLPAPPTAWLPWQRFCTRTSASSKAS